MSDETRRSGIIRSVGWREFDGEQIFCAVVQYPNPDCLPTFPVAAIWDRWPATVVALPPENSPLAPIPDDPA